MVFLNNNIARWQHFNFISARNRWSHEVTFSIYCQNDLAYQTARSGILHRPSHRYSLTRCSRGSWSRGRCRSTCLPTRREAAIPKSKTLFHFDTREAIFKTFHGTRVPRYVSSIESVLSAWIETWPTWARATAAAAAMIARNLLVPKRLWAANLK